MSAWEYDALRHRVRSVDESWASYAADRYGLTGSAIQDGSLEPVKIYFFADLSVDNFVYKTLLRKYIDHVGEEKRSVFLGDHHRHRRNKEIMFTDEEWAALQDL